MNISIRDDKLEAIKDALFQNEKITAIRIYREETGVGLAEAKEAVEEMERELRRLSPESFSKPPAKGCLGVLAVFCVPALLIALWFVARA